MINLSDPTAGDEVWVYAGTYKPQHTATNWRYDPDDPANDNYPYTPGGRENSFVLKRGVKIYGGFDSEVAGATVPPFGAAGRNGTSTLSGDLDNSGTRNSGDASHVVVGADIPDDGATVLDGFTVSGGYADGVGGNKIINGQSVPATTGGGIYNTNSSNPVLTHLTVSGNEANTGNGGGISNYSSSPVLTGVTISENTANSLSSGGGGISNYSSSPVLIDVTISENAAGNSGGGMWNTSSSPRLTRVTISKNSARILGGGISNSISSSPHLTDVTICGNKVSDAGGGMSNESSSSPHLTNVTISGNTANNSGGGGMWNSYNSVSVLTNVTISGNWAINGGGIYNYSSASPQLTNTVIWGNNTGVYDISSGAPVYANCLVQGITPAGTGNLDGTSAANDPLFISLVAATSSTPTVEGDYRLQPNSPLINSGDDAAYLTARGYPGPALPDFTGETDLAGKPRSYGAAIDIGAYEVAPVPTAPQNVAAMPGNAQVALTWTAPADNGGSTVTGYEVSIDGAWTTADAATGHLFTGLTNGKQYTFRVRAINTNGEGAASAALTTTPADIAPAAPGSFTATAGAAQVALSWTAPVPNGGSAVTGYEVSVDGAWTTADAAAGHLFTGLTNGTPYTFQVRALNAAGHGAATPAVAATPLAVPAAPQALAAAPGDAQVALSWGAPTDDGGTPVTGYKVSSDGTTWYTEPGTGYTFAGLTNGASYTFHVRAVNAVGEGPSATVPATLDSYGVTLAPAAAYAFPSATYGYGDDADADDDGAAPAPLTVTVANSGTLPTGALVVAVTGIGPDTFLLSRAALGSIPVAGSDTFSLAPAAGLAAGTYTATVTVSGGNGISAGLSVSFTVDRAEPTADALDFDLSDIVYAGKPLSVAVGAADGIAGLGEVTVKYNGFTRRPVEPGTYTVTVDIAAGANYEGVTGLLLGTFTVAVPPYPVPLLRTVTLPPFAEATTVPAAGQHAVASGEDFEFILFSAASLAGSEPAVTVDRSVAGETGVACTPNGDGSYTVLIHAVRQDLAVGVTFVDPSAGTDVVAGGGIWSSGNRVHVSSPRGGRAFVYSLTGAAVKVFDAAPGVTVSETLPAGIWIVVFDGQRRKAVVGE